jgi:hypothetical protein
LPDVVFFKSKTLVFAKKGALDESKNKDEKLLGPK